MTDTIYQCNILRHGKYILSLGVCKVSIYYVKGNKSYDRKMNDRSKGIWMDVLVCKFVV